MNYAEPRWLVLTLLPLLFWVLWGAGAQRYRQRLHDAFPKISRGPRGWQLGSWLLQSLAIIFVSLALARPRWDFRWEEVRKKGSDVVIALDVSRSMLANDVPPKRLDQSKYAIRDILEAAQGDRLGLVLFSGAAFIQCPLTSDRGSFALFLEQANTELIPVQGTALVDALKKAETALQDGEESGSQGKAIVLMSDGEDHVGGLEDVIDELNKKSIRVHTVAVGGAGAPIPLPEGGFLRDSSGGLVVSRVDEAPLRLLAEKTGGSFRRLQSTQDFAAIYRNEIRSSSGEKETMSRERIWNERHMGASALALAFLGLETLFFRRRRLQKN